MSAQFVAVEADDVVASSVVVISVVVVVIVVRVVVVVELLAPQNPSSPFSEQLFWQLFRMKVE